MCSGCIGEDCGCGNPDECVERIPDDVKAGNLVREELDRVETAAGEDEAEILDGLKSGGKRHPVQAREQTEDKDYKVNVEPGRKAHGQREGEDVCGRNSVTTHAREASTLGSNDDCLAAG